MICVYIYSIQCIIYIYVSVPWRVSLFILLAVVTLQGFRSHGTHRTVKPEKFPDGMGDWTGGTVCRRGFCTTEN